MERSFESIIEELKLRISSIKIECDNIYIGKYDVDQNTSIIEALVDDFNENLNDLQKKYELLSNSNIWLSKELDNVKNLLEYNL